MTMPSKSTIAASAVALAFLAGIVVAQETQPAAATTQPVAAEGATPIMARVIGVEGDCRHAPLGSTDWQPCTVDDEYPQETVILTGIRSSVKLQIGDDDTYTAIVIEPASKTLISEAYTTADTKRVNIGVGYGRIRAGVAEGGLKSEFTVESPVATLSKRGTWDFGMEYERGTNRFRVFLLGSGLVDALDRQTGTQRQLSTGQFVTQAMLRWAEQAQFSRNVPVPDILGQSDLEVAFNQLQQSGLRVVNPQGGASVLIDLNSAGARAAFANAIRQQLASIPVTQIPSGRPLRAEGFFGTGRGDQLIPVLLQKDSSLVERGLARPGVYNFRRSVLQNWLRNYGER